MSIVFFDSSSTSSLTIALNNRSRRSLSLRPGLLDRMVPRIANLPISPMMMMTVCRTLAIVRLMNYWLNLAKRTPCIMSLVMTRHLLDLEWHTLHNLARIR
jgi:hypothetical protein